MVANTCLLKVMLILNDITNRHPQALCIFSFALRYYGQPATMAQWICPGPSSKKWHPQDPVACTMLYPFI